MSSLATAGLAPGRSGRTDGPAGLLVREVVGLRTASLIARRGAAQRLADACLATYGLKLPLTPRAVDGRGATFIWVGPAQWLVELPPGGDEIEPLLGAAFGELASVCEQSDSRVVLEVAGPRVRDVLAKGLPIDLHPDAFRSGDVAVSAIAHVGVQLRQTADTPVYRLAVVRSYIGSFGRWLGSSAAEYGCETLAPMGGATRGG